MTLTNYTSLNGYEVLRIPFGNYMAQLAMKYDFRRLHMAHLAIIEYLRSILLGNCIGPSLLRVEYRAEITCDSVC